MRGGGESIIIERKSTSKKVNRDNSPSECVSSGDLSRVCVCVSFSKHHPVSVGGFAASTNCEPSDMKEPWQTGWFTS